MSGDLWGDEGAQIGLDETSWDLIAARLTDRRRDKILAAARHRTHKVRLIVQDIHDPHNIAACLRSAEAFGVQNIDIVNLYQNTRDTTSTAGRGTSHWLTLHRWDSVATCAEALKAQGYVIYAGYPPGGKTVPLANVPVSRPVAVLFGNEHRGVSSEWLPFLDGTFTIPMVGMVESLNISVSAAITMQRLAEKSLDAWGADFYLSPSEAKILAAEWAVKRLRNPEAELRRRRADAARGGEPRGSEAGAVSSGHGLPQL